MKKFTFYKQTDSMMCGISCLQMICKYYGKELSQSAIGKFCHATSRGVSLLGIHEAAQELGFTTQCCKLHSKDMQKEYLPCILHWNQKHFVVLYKVKKGRKFYIADPYKGLLTYSYEDFNRHWIGSSFDDDSGKGIAMFLEPTSSFYEMKENLQEKESRSFKFLLTYIRHNSQSFIQIVLGLLIGSLLQLVLPFLTQQIVDVGIKNQK